MADVLPADQLQSTLTAAQQGDSSTARSISPSRCAYPLGPLCADGVLGVAAFGVGAVATIAAVVLLARDTR